MRSPGHSCGRRRISSSPSSKAYAFSLKVRKRLSSSHLQRLKRATLFLLSPRQSTNHAQRAIRLDNKEDGGCVGENVGETYPRLIGARTRSCRTISWRSGYERRQCTVGGASRRFGAGNDVDLEGDTTVLVCGMYLGIKSRNAFCARRLYQLVMGTLLCESCSV